MKSEVITGSEECITEDGVQGSATQVLDPGHLLLVVRSGILKHTIPVAINAVPVAMNQDLRALRFDKTRVQSEYFLRWVQGLNDRLLLEWSKQGATVESIEHDYFANSVMALPSTEEQRGIVAFLDRETAKIDALVAEQERLIELLKEKRQAVISHAVTKGLDPSVPMKDSGVEWLGEVPAHWDVKRLKRLLVRNDGGVWGHDPVDETDTVVLRSTEQTVDGHWAITDPARRRLSATEERDALLEDGDLLITKSSGSELHIGKTTLVSGEVAALRSCFSNFMQRLRTSDEYRPKLAWYTLNNRIARTQFALFSSTSTGLANLNGTTIGDLLVTVPPPHEQVEVISWLNRVVDRLEVLSGEARRAIGLLQERRSALISAAVTGQIDVRNAVPVEAA